jgi:hypothetical protein
MSPNDEDEQVAHNVVDREEPLGLCRRFEAAHVALASARRPTAFWRRWTSESLN